MKYLIKFLLQFFLVLAVLVCASVLDIIFAAMSEIFSVYSYALFIVIFGVAGIFAAAFTLSPPGYFKKAPVPLWVSLLFNIIISLLYYFPFALLIAGEYLPAFRSLGVMFFVASIFFYWLFKKEEKQTG